MKSQKFRNKIFPILIVMFTFIFAFQNCAKNKDNPINIASTTGDKAIFKLSETYGGDNVSKVSWQTKSGTACGKSTAAVKTGLNLEIPWNHNYGTVHDWGAFTIAALIHLEQEECFIYRNFTFGDAFSLDRLSCVRQTGFLSFSLSNDPSINRNYFPVDSSINLEFNKNKYEDIEESLEDKIFQWSIKKVGDDTELADQSHTSPQLTHTFSEVGLYDISIKETPSGFNFNDDTELLIGLCEEEVEAVEVVLSEESFGDSTPKGILETGRPIFNYVRPSDTDTNNKVTLIFNDSRGAYSFYIIYRPLYKYKRNSTSKFIDIDIQNADECFLDTEPVQTCENTTNCTYEVNEDLSPLSSCSGNALDMSTLDTDTTKCTDDVFIVAASKEGQDKIQRTFYKHCPADEDYCYFGDERDRPSDHNCPSS